jgi:hypothetical protein
MKKQKTTEQKQRALEPHELASELTHEQRVSLAKGLGDLYRRKVAEDAARKASIKGGAIRAYPRRQGSLPH